MRPYTVQLHVYRSRDESLRGGQFDLKLVDIELASTSERAGVGTSFLDLRAQNIPGLGLSVLSVKEFLVSFLRGDGGTQEDGLRFGQHLLRCLLADKEVEALWNGMNERRRAERRPLRLELLLPEEEAGLVSDIPFELLADETGFLFRQIGSTLVRAIRRMPVCAVELAPGDAILVAWANPMVENRLTPEVFEQHEEGTQRAATKVGLTFRDPCRQATRDSLEVRLVEGGGTPIVSLVAHGDEVGGAIYLHQGGHPAYPDDQGDPVAARDFAGSLRRGNVRVAFLWTCHSGRYNPVSGALATALLHPDHGNLAAVVASHAALRAEGTAKMMERILGSLRTPANGDLERAVSEGRHALGETDLQWAAPVYYARPSGGRSVTLSDTVARLAASIGNLEAPGVGEVERAPGQWPHFRGREHEIAGGMALLHTGRLVSVTGMAGMGKTEVALEIAREATKAAGLGLKRVIWLALDGVTRADALRATLAVVFGGEAKECLDDATLARRIGMTRALVVLDNAEDLIRSDKSGLRGLVDTTLRDCPQLRLLLATRERLGSVRACEEHVCRIGMLAPHDAREVFMSVAGSRLEREGPRSHGLKQLLAWLDGHPLSLVLVARQVGTMPISALLRRLEKHGADAVQIDELFGEEVTADQDEKLRKERLVSSLNLSYRPLAEKVPGAAEMFAWLGHFPAGLPGVLVPLIFGEDGEELQSILLRKGLAEEFGREKRLILPAPIRAYARVRAREIPEHRKQQLAIQCLKSLGDWFTALCNRSESSDAREAMNCAARDDANLDALLSYLTIATIGTFSVGDRSEVVEKIAAAIIPLGKIALYNGQPDRLIGITDRAKLIAEHVPGQDCAVANILAVSADLHHFSSRLDEAEKAYKSALSIYESLDHRHGQASMLLALGELCIRRSFLGKSGAETLLFKAITLFSAENDQLEIANAQRILGELYARTDRLPEAHASYHKALLNYRVVGSRVGEANIQKATGDLYMQFNRLEEAEDSYKKALPIYKDVGHRLLQANLLRSLGELYFRTDRAEDAEVTLTEALSLYSALGEPIGEANATVLLGVLREHSGRLEDAERAFKKAIEVQIKSGDSLGLTNTHKALGNLLSHAGRDKEAEATYDEALRIARGFGDPLSLANALTAIGGFYGDAGRLTEAEVAYEEALQICRSSGSQLLGEANCLSGLGNLAFQQGDLVRSFELNMLALSAHRSIGDDWGVASMYGYLARVILVGGDPLRAVALAARSFRLIEKIGNKYNEVQCLISLGLMLGELGMDDVSQATALLAWARAIPIGHPYAAQMGMLLGGRPPSIGEVFHYQILLIAAIATCEEDFALRGDDIFAPVATIAEPFHFLTGDRQILQLLP